MERDRSRSSQPRSAAPGAIGAGANAGDADSEPETHEEVLDDDADLLDPREAARDSRRDHDAEAEGRDLMKPGMGKVFKQIQDAQARRGREARRPKGP